MNINTNTRNKIIVLLLVIFTLTACSSQKTLNVSKDDKSKDGDSYGVKTFEELDVEDGYIIERNYKKLLEDVKKVESDIMGVNRIFGLYKDSLMFNASGKLIVYGLKEEKVVDVLPLDEFRLDGCCSYTATEMYGGDGIFYLQNSVDQFDTEGVKKPDYYYEYNINNKEFKIAKGESPSSLEDEYDISNVEPINLETIKVKELEGYEALSEIAYKVDNEKLIVIYKNGEIGSTLAIAYLDENNNFIKTKSIYE